MSWYCVKLVSVPLAEKPDLQIILPHPWKSCLRNPAIKCEQITNTAHKLTSLQAYNILQVDDKGPQSSPKALPWCEDWDRLTFPWGMWSWSSEEAQLLGSQSVLGDASPQVYFPWRQHNELHYLIMLMNPWQWSLLRVAVVLQEFTSERSLLTQWKCPFKVFLAFLCLVWEE